MKIRFPKFTVAPAPLIPYISPHSLCAFYAFYKNGDKDCDYNYRVNHEDRTIAAQLMANLFNEAFSVSLQYHSIVMDSKGDKNWCQYADSIPPVRH